MLSKIFTKTTPDAIVRRLTDLPKAPRILHTLQKMVRDPESNLNELAEIVQLEPGLSARVVKVANSTHFGRGKQVGSVMEAIQRVGMSGVHELVTFAVASNLVGRPLVNYGLDAQNLWFRAVTCGMAASSLAERCDADAADAYTSGLMHGLGLLVIDRHAAHIRSERMLSSAGYPLDYALAEREWLGFSHAEAGASLLEFWGFPPSIVEPVRYQLTPAQAGEHRQMSMILATSRWARSLFCVPEETVPELPDPTWLEEAGIKIENFSDWLGQIRRRCLRACDELKLS